MILGTPVIEYQVLKPKTLCSGMNLIRTAEHCKLAAERLNIPWKNSYREDSSNEIGGCRIEGFRQRMQAKEYWKESTGFFGAKFNEALDVKTDKEKINIDFRAICGVIEGSILKIKTVIQT